MKQFVTLELIQTGGYTIIEKVNFKFYLIYEILNFNFYNKDFAEPNLLTWLDNQDDTSYIINYAIIHKEKNSIALYDISHTLNAEDDNVYYPTVNSMLDENKRFDMSYKNFEEILLRWEELRVSMPEIILLVIHEDNHVSLETDPTIIKEYQDAGYDFDIDKEMEK